MSTVETNAPDTAQPENTAQPEPNIPTADGHATEGATGSEPETQGEHQTTTDGEQKAPEAQATPEVPESYEFKAPEGMELDEGLVGALTPWLKEQKLSQEGAQALIDNVSPALNETVQKAVEAGITERDRERSAEWAMEAQRSKTFKADMTTATRAFKQFGDDELTQVLNDTGLGNHPALIRAFAKAGKAISPEDSFLTGGGPVTPKDDQSPRGDAKAFFPEME